MSNTVIAAAAVDQHMISMPHQLMPLEDLLFVVSIL